MTRWIASIAAAMASIPAGYAASVLVCGPSQLGTLFAATNALTLVH